MCEIIYHQPIPGFDGYTATRDGDIYSWKKKGKPPLKLKLTYEEYVNVALIPTGGGLALNRGVHTFVAKAWIPNPKNKPTVNHKDFNTYNNSVSNLEWMTRPEQAQHARDNGVGIKGREVCQLDLDGNLIATFKSIVEAAKKTHIGNRDISQVCVGKRGRKTAGGFMWCYKEDLQEGVPVGKHGCSRPVLQYTLDDIFVRRFESVGDAAAAINKSHSNISRVLSGHQKTAGGFKWYDVEDEEIDERTEIEKESEDWVILERFPGHKISKDGRVYSILYRRTLAGSTKQDGRHYVTISDNKGKLISIAVYRLVALAYIPNPNNYRKVNHLDHDPSNDLVENLEWANHSRDAQHTYDEELNAAARPVIQISLEGKFIRRYRSLAEACRALKISRGALGNVLNGRNQTCAGFRWMYDEKIQPRIR